MHHSGCGDNGATMLLMRRSKQFAAHKQLVFEWPEWITVNGSRISYGAWLPRVRDGYVV